MSILGQLRDGGRGLHLEHQLVEGLDGLIVDAPDGQLGGCRLEDAAHLEELHLATSAEQLGDEPGALHQHPGLEAGDVRAVAVPHVEDLDQRERPDGLAERAAGDAQLGREVGLRRQPAPVLSCPDMIIALIFWMAWSATPMATSLPHPQRSACSLDIRCLRVECVIDSPSFDRPSRAVSVH